MDLVHPEDGVLNGQLTRSPFSDVPSGNPLLLVEPKQRAAFVLMQAGEDSAEVGLHILHATSDPRRAARRAVAAVERKTNVRFHLRRRTQRLRELLPEHHVRWVFLLRASGHFPATGQNRGSWSPRVIAGVLRVHRASAMRHSQKAHEILERYTAQPQGGTPACRARTAVGA